MPEGKNKKTARERFPPLFWANLKALWESGQFGSVDQLYDYGKTTFKKMPPQSSIYDKIKQEGWDKAKNREIIDKKIELSYAEYFESQEMGAEERTKRVCLGIDAPKRTAKIIVDYATQNGGKIDDDTLKKFAQMMQYDLRTAEGYLDMANKMTGGYAATKIKHSGSIKSDDSNITLEEAIAEHERVHKNLAAAGLLGKS